MKPKQGYALKKEAAGTIDPYQNYTDSVVAQDAIWDALLTESGRQAIGA